MPTLIELIEVYNAYTLTPNIFNGCDPCRRQRQKQYYSAKNLDAGRAMRQFFNLAMWLATAAIICGNALAGDTLQHDFLAPPVNAKPVVWWFWGETVITDHGITEDLEALKRVGFGGVVIYEQVFTDRPGVEKPFARMA